VPALTQITVTAEMAHWTGNLRWKWNGSVYDLLDEWVFAKMSLENKSVVS